MFFLISKYKNLENINLLDNYKNKNKILFFIKCKKYLNFIYFNENEIIKIITNFNNKIEKYEKLKKTLTYSIKYKKNSISKKNTYLKFCFCLKNPFFISYEITNEINSVSATTNAGFKDIPLFDSKTGF